MAKAPTPVPIGEVLKTLESGVSSPLDERHNLRYSGGSSLADTISSPIVDPLLTAETAVLIVSPRICARHFAAFAYFERAVGPQLGKYMFANFWWLYLEERDLISGDSVAKAKKALLEMASELKGKIKAIVLCCTCVDMLLATDFKGIAKEVEEETGMRIGLTSMCVLLNDSTNSPDYARTWKGLFELLRTDPSAPKEPTVNLIGVRPPLNEQSELPILLRQAGIEKVHQYRGFKTIEEFDAMGQATLTLGASPRTKYACELFKNRYDIPYVFIKRTFDLDELHENYQIIGEALGFEIDDSKYYDETKKYAEHVADLCAGKTVAVGEEIDESSFKAAKDLCKLGFDVKAVFSRFVKPQYIEEIRWLANNKPDVMVHYSGHPSMYYYPETAPHYDISVGINSLYTAGDPTTASFTIDHRNPDYCELMNFLKLLEESVGEKAETPAPEPPAEVELPLGVSNLNKMCWFTRAMRQ